MPASRRHESSGTGVLRDPREATYADVAERLDCAPKTATEHLQKAEAKLVRNAMNTPGEST